VEKRPRPNHQANPGPKWAQIRELLKAKIDRQKFLDFVKPLRVLKEENGTIDLQVPDPVFLRAFTGPLREALDTAAGETKICLHLAQK
jgi:hypothetical protein